ncbi:MAG: WD40 repeat domain-containing protein [Gemmataceae bacterium]
MRDLTCSTMPHSRRPSAAVFHWSRCLLGALLVLVVFVWATSENVGVQGQEAVPPGEEQAAAILNDIRAKFEQNKDNPDRIRRELLVFRRLYGGTSQAVGAAQMLRKLSSPLDKLDPGKIPALDRFDWQPLELAAVLGEHRGRQGSEVHSVAYSPDGKWIASGGTNHRGVRIWDSNTLRQIARVPHGYAALSLAFDRESKRLAVGGSHGNLRVWDMTTDPPTELRRLHASSTAIHDVEFSPDGRYVACACQDTQVLLWDLGDPMAKFPKTLQAHQGPARGVAFAPNGKTLYSCGNDGALRVWDLTGVDPVERAYSDTVEKRSLVSLSMAPDGFRAVTGHSDGTLSLWNLTQPKPREVATIKAHTGAVHAVNFSRSGRTVASGGQDSKIKLWDVSRGQPVERYTLEGHEDPVSSLDIAPNGTRIVSGSADWTVRLWSLVVPVGGKPYEVYPPKGHLSHVYTTATALDGLTLASGSEDRSARIWEVGETAMPRQRHAMRADPRRVYSIAYHPDSKTIAAGGSSHLKLWDGVSGKELRPFQEATGHVVGLSFNYDGNKLVGINGKELGTWETLTGRALRRMEGHDTLIRSMSLSLDGKYALTGAGYYLYKNGKIVYDDKTKDPIYTDCTVRLWDLENGQQLDRAEVNKRPISSVVFLLDGRAISSAYEEGARMWKPESGKLKPLPELPWDRERTFGMVPAPDGKTLAMRGPNGEVLVWDIATGRELFQWRWPEVVGGLSFSADSRYLFVGLGTGPIYVLRLAEAEYK